MVKFSVLLPLGLVASVHATPVFEKRIQQVVAQATSKWEQACRAAGGGHDRCNALSVASMPSLLLTAGPCDQQNSADQQIDLAKGLANPQEMIRLSQIFAQQARNSPDSVSMPYCQQAPRNQELNGLFQCQFQGVNKKVFVGNVQIGAPGTIPLGRNSPVQPPGSCLAHPEGPIPDGQQLVDIVQSPNAPVQANSGAGNPAPVQANVLPPSPSPSQAPPPVNNAVTPPSNPSKVADGQSAQQQNAKFATLKPDSPCTSGDVACIDQNFAKCDHNKFVITSCRAGSICAALPLVGKPGTVVTCTTQADAISFIHASGATGGLTG